MEAVGGVNPERASKCLDLCQALIDQEGAKPLYKEEERQKEEGVPEKENNTLSLETRGIRGQLEQ